MQTLVTKHRNSEFPDRKCLWPVLHSTHLINQNLDENTLLVLKILVAVAFCRARDEYSTEPSGQETSETRLAEALQVVSQISVNIEAAPQQVKTQDAQLLASYQRHELDACRWLDKILNELSSRRTWRSVEEVMREIDWTGSGDCPFIADAGEGLSPTPAGKDLSRELKILVSKYGETQVGARKNHVYSYMPTYTVRIFYF